MDDDDVIAPTNTKTLPHEPELMEHGGPLRTVVPKRYFWKSAKFLRALEFSPVDKPGFWELGGYHNDGDFWKQERFQRRGFSSAGDRRIFRGSDTDAQRSAGASRWLAPREYPLAA